jgi:Ohr subfamily peroxiredoxin
VTTQLTRPLYTARAAATGGREGHVASDDGILDVDLRPPREMGGAGGATNPEQLFAAGYAACFQSALGGVGRREKMDTSESAVEADVTIGAIHGGGYGLAVTLRVTIPGADPARARALTEAAHQACPYSNATRGNVEVTLEVG